MDNNQQKKNIQSINAMYATNNIQSINVIFSKEKRII